MKPTIRLRTGCILILLTGVIGCFRDDASPAASAGGESSRPQMRLLDLDGRPFDLWTQDKSGIVVVLFTRTDCPVSNQYAPEIHRLYDTYHPCGVEFYLIYVDPREKPDDIRRHLREYDYPCPGLRDPEHTLVALCNATTTPEAVVFARDHSIKYRGRVDDRFVEVGQSRAQRTRHDLSEAINATMFARPIVIPETTAIGCPIADLKN